MADIPFEMLGEALAGHGLAGDGLAGDALASRPGLPKWQRIADAMRAAVLRGEFRPGDRVPPETALTHSLPVSLGTLQKAMRALAEEGLIVRHRRSGTYIADRRSQVRQVYVYRFRDPQTGELMMPFVRALAVTREDSAGPWRDALGGPCIRVDRLVWVDRDPPAFSSLFLRPSHGEPMMEAGLERLHGSSCHHLLAERFNLPTLRMEHSIACGALSSRAAGCLHVEPGSPGLIWDVRDFSLDDEPILFQRFEMPPGHRPMELVEAVEPGGAAGRPSLPHALKNDRKTDKREEEIWL